MVLLYMTGILGLSNEYSSLDTVKYSYDTGVGKTASQLSDESNFIVQQLMDGLMLPWLLLSIVLPVIGVYKIRILIIFMWTKI